MRLSLIRQLWGIDKPWATTFKSIANLGFDGVEIALPFLDPFEKYINMLAENELDIIPMIFTAGESVDEHVTSFRDQAEAAAKLDPVKINCHDGRDFWSLEQSKSYFGEILSIEKDLGVDVAHETHRGRIFYNPWTTATLLEKFDTLQLCCDFSHWVCVCERLIDDQIDIIQACAERTIHVHGRVGYNEGPQVPDPRVPLYATELEAHERWWDIVWSSQKKRSMDVSTFTPEFGPPPYMQTDPSSGNPLANLWDVSNWMAMRQRDRFANHH